MAWTLATNALVNLATVKSELNISDSSQDDRLTRLINSASNMIEAYCGRKRFPFYQASTVEMIGVPGGMPPRIVLTRTPVTAVASVYTDLDPGPGTVVDPANYFLEDGPAGFIYSVGRWRTTAIRRPDIVQDRDPGTEEETVQVTYTGGWITQPQADASGGSLVRNLPYDLEQAAIDTVVALYRRAGENTDIQSESLGNYSVTYKKRNGLPPTAIDLLQEYRKWSVG